MEHKEEYVKFFRQSSPYIHAHRGSTFVIMLPGEVMEGEHFSTIISDIALLSSLGVRLVLAYGARPQINARITNRHITSTFHNGVRITDKDTLPAVIDASGSLRMQIEAKLSMGLINSPMHGARIRVVGGNFVTARPLGVVDGHDYQHTGEVRKIDCKAISQQLDEDHVVLLSCTGFSSTGEVFNLLVEEVATRTAIALKAEKLILFSSENGVKDENGQQIRTIRPSEARSRLMETSVMQEYHRLLEATLVACDNGIKRTHIISHKVDGSLLQELFSREGCGTLVTQDIDAYEQIRPATIEDVGGILGLIQPLEDQGVLVRRSRKKLERDIALFTVIVRDGMIIGCASLYTWPDNDSAELACLVTHQDYRNGNRGDTLLETIEQQARQQDKKSLFVLTTRTAHWFVERGFSPSGVKVLPEEKQRAYSRPRNSKVFSKVL